MELPHIGTQCGNPSCNQLDFLPFRCSGCTKQFCINHRKQGDHSCTAGAILEDTVIPVCPLCFSSVPIRNGENPNEIVERHINAGCPDHDDERRQRKKAKACSLRSCGKSELVPIICPDCNRQFCLTHRAPMDHKCRDIMNAKKRAAKSAWGGNFSDLWKGSNTVGSAGNSPTSGGSASAPPPAAAIAAPHTANTVKGAAALAAMQRQQNLSGAGSGGKGGVGKQAQRTAVGSGGGGGAGAASRKSTATVRAQCPVCMQWVNGDSKTVEDHVEACLASAALIGDSGPPAVAQPAPAPAPAPPPPPPPKPAPPPAAPPQPLQASVGWGGAGVAFGGGGPQFGPGAVSAVPFSSFAPAATVNPVLPSDSGGGSAATIFNSAPNPAMMGASMGTRPVMAEAVCPICNRFFPTKELERHANSCAASAFG